MVLFDAGTPLLRSGGPADGEARGRRASTRAAFEDAGTSLLRSGGPADGEVFEGERAREAPPRHAQPAGHERREDVRPVPKSK